MVVANSSVPQGSVPGRARTLVRTLAQRLTLDRQLEFWMQEVDPAWSLHTLRARVVDVVAETHDVRTFVLAPNGLWPGHRAGQFVTVEVEVEGVRTPRCYSIASAPGESHVAITVKRVPRGRVSTFLHDHVQPGHVLHLGRPMGEFTAPSSPSGEHARLLLLSGGSGITPVMSILRDLARRDVIDDVVFVHAARSWRDVVFREELSALATRHPGLRLVFVLEDDRERGGRLDVGKLDARVGDLAERHTLLCGPAGMMAALSPRWTETGLTHRLKTERFAPPRALMGKGRGTNTPVKLELVRSGKTIASSVGEASLLGQLERAGERPAHGCRMGICNTCVCRKLRGVVENLVTGAVSSEPDEDIRLCVSRAQTDLELVL